jgi:hypothetical protein
LQREIFRRASRPAKKQVAKASRHENQHSPIRVSPSLWPKLLMEQNVAVRNPPLTRSISSAFKSRAPLRINTLFWSFIFFPFHQLGPLIGPKVFKEKFFG